MKENKQKIGNKGFSLIELIIVMAIMAVLVGALAPQYLKYVERARRSNDIQAAATIGRAAQIALADMTIEEIEAESDNQEFNSSEILETAPSTTLPGKLYPILGKLEGPESTGFTDFKVEVATSTGIPVVTVSADGVELFPTADPDFKDGVKAEDITGYTEP